MHSVLRVNCNSATEVGYKVGFRLCESRLLSLSPCHLCIQVQVSEALWIIFDNDDNVDTIVELQPYYDDYEREAYPAFPFLSRKSTPFVYSQDISILVYSVDQCRVLIFFGQYLLLQAHIILSHPNNIFNHVDNAIFLILSYCQQ